MNSKAIMFAVLLGIGGSNQVFASCDNYNNCADVNDSSGGDWNYGIGSNSGGYETGNWSNGNQEYSPYGPPPTPQEMRDNYALLNPPAPVVSNCSCVVNDAGMILQGDCENVTVNFCSDQRTSTGLGTAGNSMFNYVANLILSGVASATGIPGLSASVTACFSLSGGALPCLSNVLQAAGDAERANSGEFFTNVPVQP